jgi:hypothetical protein
LEGGFSENITLLQRRPVDDLALTLALAYSLREERLTKSLNDQAESNPPTPSTSTPLRSSFPTLLPTKSNEEKDKTSLKKVPSDTPTQQPNGLSRWGRTFFKTTNSSVPNLPLKEDEGPRTPPPPPPPPEEGGVPARFSPGAWGASLSAASRKLNKLRITPGSPASDTSPTSSKDAVHLDDRMGIARVTAVVRDSFERRGEIIHKVGGWVANTSDPEAHAEEGEEEEESAATAEIRRLEKEVGGERKVLSPEEYIARIKRRRDEREAKEGKVLSSSVGIDDPLGVGRV